MKKFYLSETPPLNEVAPPVGYSHYKEPTILESLLFICWFFPAVVMLMIVLLLFSLNEGEVKHGDY